MQLGSEIAKKKQLKKKPELLVLVLEFAWVPLCPHQLIKICCFPNASRLFLFFQRLSIYAINGL